MLLLKRRIKKVGFIMNETKYNFTNINLEKLEKIINEKLLKIIIQTENSNMILKN